MNIKPLGDRVLLKPMEAEAKTKSGLYIPESAKETPKHAHVVAVGNGDKIKVKVGDKVIHESYGGTDVTIEGTKHVLMDMKDILAIIE